MTHISLKPNPYLQALRRGDEELIEVRPELSEEMKSDFHSFRTFLSANGHPNPTPSDLYLVIERTEVLRLLTYAADRNCLGLQHCFGFDRLVYQSGRFLFVNKGAIVDRHCEGSDPYACEDAIYRSDFQVRDADSPNWYTPHFLNFRLNHELPSDLTSAYINNFKAVYDLPSGKFLQGSVLSVRRLRSILTDAGTILGTTQLLTFRWGIADIEMDSSGKLVNGSFSFAIGINDVSQGPVIERRPIFPVVEDPSDCPPRKPCGNDS